MDYDGSRHTVESLTTKTGKKDDIKIAKSRESMEEARRLYEVLNKELHDELPALYDSRIPFLISTLQTLFASETTFHVEYGKLSGQFAELIDALAIEAQKGAYHVGSNQRALGAASGSANGLPTRPYEEITYNGEDVASPSSPDRKKPVEESHEKIPVGATTTDLPPGVLYKVRHYCISVFLNTNFVFIFPNTGSSHL